MRITERFEAINCKPEDMLLEQISEVEKLLEEDCYYVELDNDIVIIKGVGAGETNISYELD